MYTIQVKELQYNLPQQGTREGKHHTDQQGPEQGLTLNTVAPKKNNNFSEYNEGENSSTYLNHYNTGKPLAITSTMQRGIPKYR